MERPAGQACTGNGSDAFRKWPCRHRVGDSGCGLARKVAYSSSTSPHFNAASTVARGKSVTILTFFGNPRLDAEGKADLTCDIDLIEPGGKSAMHQAGLVCFRGALQGGPNKVYLAAPSIDIGTTASDTPGTYTVRVTLRDNLRKTVLPLKTSFVLM
jgi:hypothetical protein